jgi:hypothetical protein
MLYPLLAVMLAVPALGWQTAPPPPGKPFVNMEGAKRAVLRALRKANMTPRQPLILIARQPSCAARLTETPVPDVDRAIASRPADRSLDPKMAVSPPLPVCPVR